MTKRKRWKRDKEKERKKAKQERGKEMSRVKDEEERNDWVLRKKGGRMRKGGETRVKRKERKDWGLEDEREVKRREKRG